MSGLIKLSSSGSYIYNLYTININIIFAIFYFEILLFGIDI